MMPYLTSTSRDQTVPIIHHDKTYKMQVRAWGPPSAPLHVMATQGVGQHRGWTDFVAPAFGDAYVVAQDQLGRGDSDRFSEKHVSDYYDFEIDNQHTDQIMKAMGVRQPFIWFGTSSGAAMGIIYAANHPDRVKALIINDIAPRVPAATMQVLAYLWTDPVFPSKDAWIEVAIKANLNFGPDFTHQHWQFLADTSLKPVEGGFRRKYDPRIGQNFMRAAEKGIDLTAEWKEISCPILFIRGEKSIFTPQDLIDEAKTLQPKMEVYTVPGAMHPPALHDADSHQVIRQFLSNLR